MFAISRRTTASTAFVLNAQGRIQGDLVAYNRGDYLLVTTDREQARNDRRDLRSLHHHGRCRGRRHQRQAAAVGLAGPKAAEVLRAAGIDVSQLAPGQVIDTVWRDIGISVARSAQPQMDGYEIWFAAENARQSVGRLVFSRRNARRQRGPRALSHRPGSTALRR